jgi:hypothetical protein
MKRSILHLAAIYFLTFSFNTSAAVLCVDLNSPNPISPYADWGTAATNIQDAVDAAGDGDRIWVTNGIYETGGRLVFGTTTNRVAINKAVTVQSVNGPAVTVIKGYQIPGTTNGLGAVRCVFLTNGAVLTGFTLTNGATVTGTGGGIMCLSTSAIVSNCVLIGNSANLYGGGVSGGTLHNCLVAGNTVTSSTGAGGGVFGSTLYNCTLTGNSTMGSGLGGGGGDAATFYNCIIYYNDSLHGANYSTGCAVNFCCTTPRPGGSGNITNAPAFMDLAGGNLRLKIVSPCINAGDNASAPAGSDLDGNPRIANGTVDMGAYENQNTNLVHYVSLNSTNPVSPYTNWLTAATNIQDAVSTAQNGEMVVVGDGVYNTGGTVIYGQETNRVALTNAITLLSLNGTLAAIIAGGTQTRGAYVSSNAVLSGFTITNGHARGNGDITNERSGGGVWCESGGTVSDCRIIGNIASNNGRGGGIWCNPGGVVSNCLIVANLANNGWGGGIFGGTVYNSTLVTNEGVSAYGGGAASASLFNCLVASNGMGNISYGSGTYQCLVSNCTLLANGCYSVSGGGAYQSTLYNCLVASNYSGYGAGGAQYGRLYDCTLIGNQGTYGGTYQCTNYHCTLRENSGSSCGGMYDGVSYNCLVISNLTLYRGGGAYQGTLYNCILSGNRVTSMLSLNALGGGAYGSTLYNCTVVSNLAVGGGGIYGGWAYNSIIYFNSAAIGPNWTNTSLVNCCSTALPYNSNFITNDPSFVNPAGGDYHLRSNSICINSGNNVWTTNSTDYDGNPRIVAGLVDIGAYEYQGPGSVLPYAWLWQYGLTNNGSADNADTDHDGMSNYNEWRAGTIPTNAASVLALQSPVVVATNLTITWQSVSGHFYCVQRTTDLSVPFSTLQTDILGHTGTTSYTDTNAVGNGPFYYRVGLQ